MTPTGWKQKLQTTVVSGLLFISLLKMISTSNLAWAWVSFWLGVAGCISQGYTLKENPLTLSKRLKEQHNLMLDELASQSEQLSELEWALKEKESELDKRATGLVVQTEDYAHQLRVSAESQITELVQDYENKLEYVNQERILQENKIDYLLQKIDTLTAPKLPTASDPASLLATQLCKELGNLNCPVDYERCWYEAGDVIVWVKPRKGGLKAVAKHLEELQLKLSLLKKPLATIINGVVQVVLKPMPYSEPEPDEVTPLRGVYELTTNDARKQLMNAWSKEAPPRVVGFIEPLIVLHPAGAISKLESDWILSCHYKGMNERATIARVYGATGSKQTQLYAACLERYNEVIGRLQEYE